MAYPHKWSPIGYKSSAGQRKHIGQRPMLYRWTTQPSISASDVYTLDAVLFCHLTNSVKTLKETQHAEPYEGKSLIGLIIINGDGGCGCGR